MRCRWYILLIGFNSGRDLVRSNEVQKYRDDATAVACLKTEIGKEFAA